MRADAIDFTGGTNNSLTLNTAQGVINGGLSGGIGITGTLNFLTNGATATLSNVIHDYAGAGSIAKTDAGTLILTGVNTYTGGTTLSDGILAVGADSALGATSGSLTFTGGTLEATASFSSARSVTLNTSGTIQVDGAANTTLTLSGIIADGAPGAPGASFLAKTGDGTLKLSVVNTFTGELDINGGTVQAGTGSVIGKSTTIFLINNNSTFDLNNYDQAVGSINSPDRGTKINLGSANLTTGYDNTNGSIFSSISGSGSFTKVGAGSLTLDSNNSYTGATTVQDGFLGVTGSGSILSTEVDIIGGTFNVDAFVNLAIPNDIIVKQVGGLFSLGGSYEIGSLSGSGGSGVQISQGETLTTGRNSTADTYGGNIGNDGNGALIKVETGTFTLTGASSYTGTTTINGGTLQLGDGLAGNAGTLSNSTAISLGDNLNGTGTLAIDHAGAFTLANTITGAGNLIQLGTGTTTLTGTDGYTGTTTVSAGTLLVNGSISASATTVQTGGTLGGSGTTGAVTVASGGFLSPGNSPGLLSTGSLALANGATYVEQIGGTTVGTQYDQTNVTGTVNLNNGNNAAGGATLSATFVNGFTPSIGQSYVIIINDGNDAVQGTFAGLAEGSTVTVNGVGLVISYRGGDGNDITLTDPVPPPAAPSGPTAVADTGSTIIGTTLAKAAAMGVLVNDSGSGGTLAVTAVNGQTAAVGKAVAGAYGNLTLNTDGSYVYAPDPSKAVLTGSVVDHFTYTDTANGQNATTTLDITVAPPAASVLALFGTVVTNSATQTGSIYALYEGLLGRAPDPLGLESFSTSIQAGSNLTSVAQAILGSPEHGPAIIDPNAYVQSLYTNILHRTADSGGLTNFTNELSAGVSQATVAVQIATSQEAQNVNASAFSTGVFLADATDSSVARLYYGLLGRAPDAGGLQSLSAFVENGGGGAAGEAARLGQAATAILNSTEYAGRNPSGSDLAFVNGLYQGALGRSPEAGGAAFYIDQLAHGATRATVALEIAESPEAQIHLVGVIEGGFQLSM